MGGQPAMKKMIIRYGLILGFICTLAAGFLAAVNALTQPKIFAQSKQQEEKSLSEVLPDAARFEAVRSAAGEVIYYKAYDKNNAASGVAFKTEGRGYSSPIEIMAGMDGEGRLTVIKVLSQNETPGLGNRISESSFISRFSGKDISGLGSIQAITGATISSKAVIDSVKNKAEEIQSLLKNGK
jgi:Na+-translocating ferredoxin:NAD+ oxidoreductase subunit G